MIIGDKYIRRYLFFALLFFIAFIAIWRIVPIINTPQSVVEKFQSDFYTYDQRFKNISDDIFQAMEIDSLLSWENISLINNYENNKAGTFIFNSDSLIYWNDNRLDPTNVYNLPLQKTGIYHFNNGWYIVSNRKHGKWKTVLYTCIIKEYPFKNDYLVNISDGKLIADNNISFNSLSEKNGILIYDSSGSPVASLNIDRFTPFNTIIITILFLIYAGSFLFISLIIIRLHLLIDLGRVNILVRLLFILFDVLLFFILVNTYLVPSILKNSFWFEQWKSILPFINTRGAAVLFVSIFLILSINFYRIAEKHLSNIKKGIVNTLFISLFNFVLLFLLLYAFKQFYELTLKPTDSAIGFLFRRDFIELYFISFLSVSIFFFLRTFLSLLYLTRTVVRFYIAFTVIYSLLAFLIFDFSPLLYISVFFIQVLSIIIIYNTPSSRNLFFLRYLFLTVLMALGFSVIINDSYTSHKNMLQIEIVKNLKINRDYNLEGKFYILRNLLKNDVALKNLLKTNFSDDSIVDYLYNKYFSKSFKNYDVQLTICNDNDMLEIQPEGNRVDCKEYFNNLSRDAGSVAIDTSLVLMNEVGESRYYLGNLKLKADSSGVTTLFVEIFSSIVPTGLGYPELLVDKRNQIDLTGYSIAKFHQNILVYKMGEYDYHSSYSFMRPYPNNRFYFLNNYLHYKIRINASDVLIVSRPVRSFSEQLATFSLTFLLFSFLAVMVWLIGAGSTRPGFFRYSFRARLQVFIIASLLVLFVLMSLITVYYFNDIRQTFIINQLNEKSKSVLTGLQDKFTSADFNNKTNDVFLREELRKFSMMFFTDINIYKCSGILKASSRSKVFETGLLSKLINPESYKQIMINEKLFYLTTEKIGKLSYYSAYVPLNIDTGEPAGILNLPYFARETEVKKSFLPMLFNYLNIFVIIGILGTFLTLVISRVLTRPLAMLKQSLSEIRIDKKNEPIVWKNNDEIGLLIAEYNKMVGKLEESARLLKQSEREIAWREVARQVAHEIRNPLTPMKLNIQYLQKIYNDPNSGFDKKWKSISDSLIDQIEALNEVASTFFDLASSSTTEKTKIDIIQLIKSVIDLYHNHDKIEIQFNTSLENAFVWGRQNELLRVFNNLIKNAVQSIGQEEGVVTISVQQENSHCEIIISDTGSGIPDEMKEKIFQPYFTTKSGGTGIGLAIVKNIVTESGGNITFESEKNRGTRFIIHLPCIDNK